MLTANSDVSTLLSASELKLTKYLVKPVSRSELQEALDLAVDEIQNFTTLANKIIPLKDSFYWDTQNKKLLQQDKEHMLTKKEIQLLSFLLSNISRTFSVDDIIFELWYDSEEPKQTALKTLIKGLRKKLPDGTIKNVFGVGYKIET
ncbi:MAG: DNA-binding response regulator [Sulfurimonas sp.]|nr:DNA-binding response regulator [Sulfurimonas sp.]